MHLPDIGFIIIILVLVSYVFYLRSKIKRLMLNQSNEIKFYEFLVSYYRGICEKLSERVDDE